MPKISIIIPVYNVESYISQCLDSLINQEYDDFEIVLVDDGSTDNSYLICREYKLRYEGLITLIKQENSGVSVARNVALSKAIGEWIIFLDSDDWFANDLFSRIIPLLDLNIDILQFGFSKVSLTDSYVRIPLGSSLYSSLNLYNESKSYIPGIAGYVIRKSIIQKNRISFSEGIKYAEDHEFIFKCFLSSNSFFVLPESLYFYRDRDGSAVYRLSLDKAYGCIDVISNIEYFVKERNIDMTCFYDYWLDYSIKDFYKILASNEFVIDKFCSLYKYAKSQTTIYNHSEIRFFCTIVYYKIFNCIIRVYLRVKPLRSIWRYIRRFF